MNDDQTRSSTAGAGGDHVLRDAAVLLRERSDQRWVEISDRVLAKALRATRRSHPVRALAPGGPVLVSEQVLVAHLREAIDGQVPGSAVERIHVEVDGRDTFAGVIIEVTAQYGEPLLPIADRIHALATAELTTVLGPVVAQVSVRATHVHFSDVVIGDPQKLTPGSETPTS